MYSLGDRIKSLRERNGISQKDFAKKINVSNVVLSRYESNERKPDYDTLQLIADYFEVTTDYLLGRTDFPEYNENQQQEFEHFANDPDLQRFFYELPKSPAEDVKALQEIWEVIKKKK